MSLFIIHTFSYEPEDALEWALVLDEIKGFIKADAAVSVLHAENANPIVLSHRYCIMHFSHHHLLSISITQNDFLLCSKKKNGNFIYFVLVWWIVLLCYVVYSCCYHLDFFGSKSLKCVLNLNYFFDCQMLQKIWEFYIHFTIYTNNI